MAIAKDEFTKICCLFISQETLSTPIVVLIFRKFCGELLLAWQIEMCLAFRYKCIFSGLEATVMPNLIVITGKKLFKKSKNTIAVSGWKGMLMGLSLPLMELLWKFQEWFRVTCLFLTST